MSMITKNRGQRNINYFLDPARLGVSVRGRLGWACSPETRRPAKRWTKKKAPISWGFGYGELG